MTRPQLTDEQIIEMLRDRETGMKTVDVCIKYGISEPTFYRYKAKFAGMNASDARKLKTLEAENAKLKKLLAEVAPKKPY